MELLKNFPYHLQRYVLEFSDFKFRRGDEIYRKVKIPAMFRNLTFEVYSLRGCLAVYTHWEIRVYENNFPLMKKTTQILSQYRDVNTMRDNKIVKTRVDEYHSDVISKVYF